MRDDPADHDLMLRWRNQPHVAEWWDTEDEPSPVALDRIVERYGPRTDDSSMTTSCVIELAGLPIGYLQFYPWGAYADEVQAMRLEMDAGAFGIDVFIGEPDLVDRGIGSRAVDLLSRHLLEERGAPQVAIVTAVDNRRAQRAYEKAGFRKVGRVLDTDVRDGARVPSWLLVRDRPGLPS